MNKILDRANMVAQFFRKRLSSYCKEQTMTSAIFLVCKSICLFLILWLCVSTSALAGPLTDRLSEFPHWEGKPPVQLAEGDLSYPNWMAGTWQATSTLVELVAPLAPEIVTPGFEGNRLEQNHIIKFKVRFVNKHTLRKQLLVPLLKTGDETSVVADRSFNGLNIALAYLSNSSKDAPQMVTPPVLSVKVDPNNPNRQVTFLRGDRQLVSVVTGRASESPAAEQFLATEVSQQVFQGRGQIYLNEVETTTAYQLLSSGAIAANQMTAIYLSPQDPDYFAAARHPVALYRYRLELLPVDR